MLHILSQQLADSKIKSEIVTGIVTVFYFNYSIQDSLSVNLSEKHNGPITCIAYVYIHIRIYNR